MNTVYLHLYRVESGQALWELREILKRSKERLAKKYHRWVGWWKVWLGYDCRNNSSGFQGSRRSHWEGNDIADSSCDNDIILSCRLWTYFYLVYQLDTLNILAQVRLVPTPPLSSPTRPSLVFFVPNLLLVGVCKWSGHYMYCIILCCPQRFFVFHVAMVFFSNSICMNVLSWVSAHGRLNITRNFDPHGHLPRIKIPYICIEAATVAPWNAVHGRLPGSGRLPGTLRYMCTYTHVRMCVCVIILFVCTLSRPRIWLPSWTSLLPNSRTRRDLSQKMK